MENKHKATNKIENNQDIEQFFEASLYDYGNFKLEFLAEKIKLQSYKPRPKMLYL